MQRQEINSSWDFQQQLEFQLKITKFANGENSVPARSTSYQTSVTFMWFLLKRAHQLALSRAWLMRK